MTETLPELVRQHNGFEAMPPETFDMAVAYLVTRDKERAKANETPG